MLAALSRHRDLERSGDYVGAVAAMPADCYWDYVGVGLRYEGRPAGIEHYEMLYRAFPDLDMDKDGWAPGTDAQFGLPAAAVWGTIHGTMVGPWLGFAPTGRPFAVPGAVTFTYRDGLLRSETFYYDGASLCRQLGLPLESVLLAAHAASREPAATDVSQDPS